MERGMINPDQLRQDERNMRFMFARGKLYRTARSVISRKSCAKLGVNLVFSKSIVSGFKLIMNPWRTISRT
jgi:hypothetical protein